MPLFTEYVLMSRPSPALTHDSVWQAIDALASQKGLSPSGLARLAGLDATSFNKSKRFTPEGRPRWPSTESISKVLDVTSTSLDEFADIVNRSSKPVPSDSDDSALDAIPVVGEIRDAAVSWPGGQLGHEQFGIGSGGATSWARIALTVADASLEPVYSQGNTLIVSMREPLRAGDRVIVKPTGMQPLPRLLMREGPRRIELAAFHPEQDGMKLQRRAIDWMARIIWVRQ